MENQQISNENHNQPGMTNNLTTRSGQNLSNRVTEKRSLVDAYILGIVFGFLGVHHFYLRRIGFGILYFFTIGLFGVGYLIDLFRMPCLVALANKEINRPKERSKVNISDAYLLWFPWGILGFHHFYLKNPGFGILYFFTFGVFGIGWIVDLFRIPSLVEEYNSREPSNVQIKSVGAACVFTLCPLGLLGSHHFYMGNIEFGLTYFFTFGLFGVGWIVDWFRVCILVQRANNAINTGPDFRKYVDDAYVLWFPLGIFGLHHFYLNRPGWGIAYFFTFGMFGIGWLIDGFRIPCLVKDANKRNAELGLIVITENQPTRQGGYPPAHQEVFATSVMSPACQVILSPRGYPVSGSYPTHYPDEHYAPQYPHSVYQYATGTGYYPAGATPNHSQSSHTGESHGTHISSEFHRSDMFMDQPPPYSEIHIKSSPSPKDCVH